MYTHSAAGFRHALAGRDPKKDSAACRHKLTRAVVAQAQASQNLTAAAAPVAPRPVIRLAPSLGAPQSGLAVDPSRYPKVRRSDCVEELHGTRVADPYRWLEDPDSEETREFVAAQNQLTEEVLADCDTRGQFRELLTALYDYPKYGAPFKAGDRYYYYHNSGLQQQSAVYSQATLESDPTLFFDPNGLSEDGTVALTGLGFSDDGSLAAYSLSRGGSDWSTLQVLQVDPSGGPPTPLEDKLKYVKYSQMAWTHDNRGFFYNRYPDPASRPADLGTETDVNANQQLCYHQLGTPQSSDVVVLAAPASHPNWLLWSRLTSDGRYLVISVHQGTQPANRLYLLDLQALEQTEDGSIAWAQYDHFKGSRPLPLIKLVDDFSASFSLVANDGASFYILTNLDAPRYRLVKVEDITRAGPPSSWPDHIPQHDKDVLKGVLALKGDVMVVRYLRDVAGALQLRSLSSGSLFKELPLPGLGSVGALSGDRKSTEFFFSYTSFVEPGALYRLDTAPGSSLEPQLFRRTELQVPHNPDDYVTKQVFVPSRDGTLIPMFITHRKGLTMDGTAPTLLYGYGGFNVALEPGFGANRLAFIRGYDGVFAQANLRGGGEYGTSWRDAGSKANKQNVFDDFQSCAEFLIRERYCSPASLTIQGGSNGGLLVAAAANQRPDLFACVLGQVGVMDMARFHKFTIGHAWTTDYGNPDNAEDFSYIYPYSPVHNVRIPEGGTRQYPAVLLSTGDHDDRVVPLHTYKLLATLQYELAGEGAGPNPQQRNPMLARVDVKSGHGAGKPTQKVIDEVVDLFGFAAKCMKAAWLEEDGEDGEPSKAAGKADESEPVETSKPAKVVAASQPVDVKAEASNNPMKVKAEQNAAEGGPFVGGAVGAAVLGALAAGAHKAEEVKDALQGAVAQKVEEGAGLVGQAAEAVQENPTVKELVERAEAVLRQEGPKVAGTAAGAADAARAAAASIVAKVVNAAEAAAAAAAAAGGGHAAEAASQP